MIYIVAISVPAQPVQMYSFPTPSARAAFVADIEEAYPAAAVATTESAGNHAHTQQETTACRA
tara:strand:+ start:392 stop:580 length:189 start_codon:yes stop_codon:yes gene_type:complete